MADALDPVRDFLEGPEFTAAVRGVIETAVHEAVAAGGRLSEADVRRIASASGSGNLADQVRPLVGDAIRGFLTPESLSPIIEPVVQMAIARALKKERDKTAEQVKALIAEALKK